MKTNNFAMPSEGFVFIVTYGRSGSTMVQNLVNSIPGYEIRGENNNALLPLATSYRAILDAETMAEMRRRQQPSDQTHPWFGAEKAFPKPYGRQLAQAFVKTVLKPSPGTRVSGFKEIRFHSDPEKFDIGLDFITEFFDNAKFIFNTRDHDAVSRSGWWARQRPEQVKSVLQRAEALYDAYIAREPDRAIRIHYDDYTGRPEAMKPLFEFLGEPFDEEMVARVMDLRLDHLKKKGGARQWSGAKS